MTDKEVHVSFSLTVTLEDALLLLSRCNQKTTLSVHSAKLTKKTNPPKRQSSQSGEKAATFKKVPIPTLRRVLSALSAQYADSVFGYTDAVVLAGKLGLSRTLVGYALQYAIQQGEARKVGLGRYTFKAATKYEPAQDSLVDIVASEEGTIKLLSVFQLMNNVCKTVALYINEQGISARFFTNPDRTAMLSVFVGKDTFNVFHVNAKHTRLQVSLSTLLDVLPKGRKGEFHLKVAKQNAAFMKAGYLGNEHTLNVLGCEASDSPYEVEAPLEGITNYAELRLPRALFRDLLQDVGAHSDIVRILVNKEGAVIDSSLESRGYSKTLSAGNDPRLEIIAPSSVEQCFSVESILPFIRNRMAGTTEDILALKINKQVMMMDLLKDKDLQVSCYVSPCKVEEAAPVQKEEVAPDSFRKLQEDILELKKEMSDIKT